MSNPKQGKKAVSAVAASKAKGYKTIPGTLDLLRRNGGPKRDGKGKERAVLGGLGDLVKSMCRDKGMALTKQCQICQVQSRWSDLQRYGVILS